MGQFNGMKFTSRGIALQAKAQAGAELHFTRIAMGDGNLGSTDIATLTALISQKKSMPVSKLAPLNNGKAVVGASYSNADITTGFFFRELGVFATDPDLGEILYCYGNAGASADFIPAGGSGSDIIEQALNVITVVGNATNLTASIDTSLVFVTQEDFEAVTAAIDTINSAGWVTTTRLGSKVVTEAKIADGAASDTVIGNRTISDTVSPASNTGSITNLFSWLAYMIKSITGKSTWRTAPATTLEDANIHMNKTTSVHGSSTSATANSLAQRAADGTLTVATPTAPGHAATKGYVDTLNPYYVASDNVILSLPATLSSISAYFKKMTIKSPGTYRIKGEFASGQNGQTGQFYIMATIAKDPSSVSNILQTFSSSSSTYAVFSVDIMVPGNCLIYMLVNSSPGVNVRNVTLCGTPVAVNPVSFSGVE